MTPTKILAFAALAMLAAAPAMAQDWTTYHSPGSSYSSHDGPNGWSGTTYHSEGSSYSNTTLFGPRGQMQNCTTYHSPGSSYSSTSCY